MGIETQVAIAAVGSISTVLIALVIVALLVRLIGEQEDDVILHEIRNIRKEIKDCKTVNNYFIFDHTRNAIVGDTAGVINDQGEVTKFRKFDVDQKHRGKLVRVIVVLQDGEKSQIFG